MRFFKFYILSLLFFSCNQNKEQRTYSIETTNNLKTDSVNTVIHDSSVVEKYFAKKGLVNIHSLDTSIRVSLIYSTAQNFLHKPIYKYLKDCYLPCDVAIKLSNANYFLHEQFPNYNIIVFDAVRPLYVQKQMWNELDIPNEQKKSYLAHPDDISLHNYGAAVDVGIIGNNDLLLDMGTPFDFFSELSQPKKESELYTEGKLSKEALANRLLLRKIMEKAGFMPITSEWWHFNSTYKVMAAKNYELIE